MSPDSLDSLRQAIDQVDDELLRLLGERLRLVHRVGEWKRQTGRAIYDPARERGILDRLAAAAPAPLDGTTVRRIFERIIDESRRSEQRQT